MTPVQPYSIRTRQSVIVSGSSKLLCPTTEGQNGYTVVMYNGRPRQLKLVFLKNHKKLSDNWCFLATPTCLEAGETRAQL